MEYFSLSHTTKTFPKHPYARIKNDILGKRYMLSLSFVGATRAREINIATRNKGYVPNVLSFPLSKEAGEIYIAPITAHSEAKKFDLTKDGYIAYLYIHGLLHLKGYDHGDAMERLEKKYLAKYDIR